MKKVIKCSSGEGGHFTRTINIFKKNYKILIGILIGLIISLGGAYAATTIAGSSVTYSNSSSGLSATSVQDAIDELYNKTDIRNIIKLDRAKTNGQKHQDHTVQLFTPDSRADQTVFI